MVNRSDATSTQKYKFTELMACSFRNSIYLREILFKQTNFFLMPTLLSIPTFSFKLFNLYSIPPLLFPILTLNPNFRVNPDNLEFFPTF